MADDGAVAHELDRARVGQGRDRARDAKRVEIDDREPRLRVAGDERRERAGQRRSQAERSSGCEEGEVAAVHQLPTARQRREVPAIACSREPSRPDSRAGVRRPGLRAPRADARRPRLGRRQGRRRGRAGGDGCVGGEAPAHVRGRGPRPLLRPARLRDDGPTALRRSPLGARRGAAAGRHQLAGAGRTALLHGDPQDPHGVTLRRRFRTDGRRLLDIADEALDGSIVDGAAVGDFLLEELERTATCTCATSLPRSRRTSTG